MNGPKTNPESKEQAAFKAWQAAAQEHFDKFESAEGQHYAVAVAGVAALQRFRAATRRDLERAIQSATSGTGIPASAWVAFAQWTTVLCDDAPMLARGLRRKGAKS